MSETTISRILAVISVACLFAALGLCALEEVRIATCVLLGGLLCGVTAMLAADRPLSARRVNRFN